MNFVCLIYIVIIKLKYKYVYLFIKFKQTKRCKPLSDTINIINLKYLHGRLNLLLFPDNYTYYLMYFDETLQYLICENNLRAYLQIPCKTRWSTQVSQLIGQIWRCIRQQRCQGSSQCQGASQTQLHLHVGRPFDLTCTLKVTGFQS